jgi:hypothetical protein
LASFQGVLVTNLEKNENAVEEGSGVVEGGGASAGLLPLVIQIVVQLLRGVPITGLALVPVLGGNLGVSRAGSDRGPEMHIVVVAVGGVFLRRALLVKPSLRVLIDVSVGLVVVVMLGLGLVLSAPLQSMDLTVVGLQVDDGVIRDSFSVNFSDRHCCECLKITCGLVRPKAKEHRGKE